MHDFIPFCFTDLGRYGTYVNGAKMTMESVAPLQDGDSIKLATKVHIR